MQPGALGALEFDRIVEAVKTFALTPMGTERLSRLQPSIDPQRVFVISGVPAKTTRGGHAHRSARQLLYCPAGTVTVDVRIGESTATMLLDHRDRALVVEPGVWTSQTFETAE